MSRGKSSRRPSPGRLGFLDHLEELRKRLLISLAAIGIFSIAASFFSRALLDFLTLPLRQFTEAPLYFHTPYEAFLIYLKVSLLTGCLTGSPVLFTELWLFLAPGLYRDERRIFLPLVFVSFFLFLLGAAFAFGILVPCGLRFLLSFQTESLKPLLGVSPYFSFLLGMVFACGIVFDVPIVILGLVRAGVLGTEALQRARKGVIVGAFILTAVITPSTDPVGQILLAVPLLLLYEGSIWVAKGIERRAR